MGKNVDDTKRLIMEYRWKKLDQEMLKNGYDVLVVYGKGLITQYGNLFYLGGYYPIARLGFVIYARGRQPIAYYNTRADCYLAKEMGTIEDVRFAGTGDVVNSEKELFHEVCTAVNRFKAKKVGVVGLKSQMSFEQHEFIVDSIEAKVEDATAVMAKIKSIKTELEVDMIRRSFALAEKSFLAFKEGIRPGRSFAEIAGEVERVARGNGALDTIVLLDQGAYYLRKPTRKLLGDTGLVTAYAELIDENGYWVEKGGLFVLGNPPERTMEIANSCVSVMKEVKQTLRAGKTVGEIADVIHKHTDHLHVKMGLWHGHGVGMDHDMPIIADNSNVVLEEGMVISMHPNFSDVDETIGASIGDVFVVSKTGAESLSKIPYDIIYV